MLTYLLFYKEPYEHEYEFGDSEICYSEKRVKFPADNDGKAEKIANQLLADKVVNILGKKMKLKPLKLLKVIKSWE